MSVTKPDALTYTTPDRSSQSASEFSSNATTFATQFKTFGNQFRTSVDQLNDDIDQVNADTASIVSAANSATAAANFLGNWASLTGAASSGDSVKHDGLLWLANTAIADITAEEPGVSGDWDQIGGVVREERTANIKFVAIDFGKVIDYTSGTFTQTFDPAANLGEGWVLTAHNSGGGVITFDPDGSETINGATTLVLNAREMSIITCDGTNLFAYKITPSVGDHEVTLNTGNGLGSTNTAIRRFTTTKRSVGTAITYADSAADGASFTINETGLYFIGYQDSGSFSQRQFGVSVNSAALTTSIESISASDRLFMVNAASGAPQMMSALIKLTATDVVRPHNDTGAMVDAAADNIFSIVKVGITS